MDILENVWATLQEDPFGEIDSTPIEVDNYKPAKAETAKAKDLPPSRLDPSPPRSLRPPDVKDLSTWEYLQEVWDFQKNECHSKGLQCSKGYHKCGRVNTKGRICGMNYHGADACRAK